MTVYLGTSGWQYRHWRGRFYPRELPTERWLGFFAGWLATVEVNNTFYRLPQRSVFESWRAPTPEDFQMAIKASRYLTHVKRLRSPDEPVRRLFERAAGLGARLGPVLVQLPPTLECDHERLEEALGAFHPRSRSPSSSATIHGSATTCGRSSSDAGWPSAWPIGTSGS